MGTLYLVGTPIGNLEDISYRAIRVLREAGLIAAEDTRTARKLLTRYDIHTPVVSFHEHSRRSRLDGLLDRLESEDVAVVSEAGMPGISDPGYSLVAGAVERGVTVIPVPGPSALIAALAASALPTNSFLFLGFLPSRSSQRRKVLVEVASAPHTLVFYESPHRVIEALGDMLELLGDRRLAVARELTKLHEEIWRGTVAEAIRYFEEKGARGEFTLVVAGAADEARKQTWTRDEVRQALAEARARGLSLKMAAKEVAEASGWSRRDVYRMGLEGSG